ncbi:MAG: iron-sulfur cluster assembly accessory protein [Myxococcota bacterium]|jgi:iron-sulfur cluster assembly protein|nr:iron-sulfur cluster assembly accessory protein [Myxococcota bacterium]
MMDNLVQATDRAIQRIQILLSDEQQDASGVRLGVKGGGCSGLAYIMEFDHQDDGDLLVEQGGVHFFMDRKSSIYLKGIVLDFDGDLGGKGFIFTNPNASSTCGCGESFSI